MTPLFLLSASLRGPSGGVGRVWFDKTGSLLTVESHRRPLVPSRRAIEGDVPQSRAEGAELILPSLPQPDLSLSQHRTRPLYPQQCVRPAFLSFHPSLAPCLPHCARALPSSGWSELSFEQRGRQLSLKGARQLY